MPGDPELNLSSSTSLSAPPAVTIEPFVGVDCALISMNASSDDEDGSVYWFEAENGGDSIFYGTSFEPGTLDAGNYSYWVSPFENGECDNYNRIEIQAVITVSYTHLTLPTTPYV